MSLKSWLAKGWLTEHTTSTAEILEIMAAVERDLVDCRVQGLSADWRLNEADQMIELAEQLRDSVLLWLQKNHPDLIGK